MKEKEKEGKRNICSSFSVDWFGTIFKVTRCTERTSECMGVEKVLKEKQCFN